MFRSLLAAFMFASFLTSAHAKTLWLEGVPDCGQWVAARNDNQSVFFESFAVGLLTGMVLGSRIEVWQANGAYMSRDQLYLFVDNYCRAHPLNRIAEALVALTNERTNNAWDRLPK